MTAPRPVRQQAHPQKLQNPKSGNTPADQTAARAWRLLSESPYRELREVSCDTNDGVLVLKGQVSSFYLKQLAQEAVRRMDGVKGIANQLEVRWKPQ